MQSFFGRNEEKSALNKDFRDLVQDGDGDVRGRQVSNFLEMSGDSPNQNETDDVQG